MRLAAGRTRWGAIGGAIYIALPDPLAVIRRRRGGEGREGVGRDGKGGKGEGGLDLDICSAAPSSWLRHCHAPRRQLAPSLFQTCVYFPNMPQIMHMLQLLMRLAQYAGQALCNGPVSVRPSVSLSVCPVMDGSNCGRRVCL